MQPKIFVSHSSSDKLFVRKFKRDLHLNGVETWIDEDCLEFGDSLYEKLKTGLRSCTHFCIILSPAAIASDWVDIELENALGLLDAQLIRKIIPIHYRSCPLPQKLSKLLNMDLTRETVYIQNGSFEFHEEYYYNKFDQLIRQLREETFILSTNDKLALQGDVEFMDLDSKVEFEFKVQGFKSISKFRIDNSLPESIKEPIVLPRVLKSVFKDLTVGRSLAITNGKKTFAGQFALFSKDSMFCLTKNARTILGLDLNGKYKITVDPSNKRIEIIKPKKGFRL